MNAFIPNSDNNNAQTHTCHNTSLLKLLYTIEHNKNINFIISDYFIIINNDSASEYKIKSICFYSNGTKQYLNNTYLSEGNRHG